MEINGEAARGISHTRAIELIQAGGNKVVLLLRPGAGLAQDGSEYSTDLIGTECVAQSKTYHHPTLSKCPSFSRMYNICTCTSKNCSAYAESMNQPNVELI